jgi:predicted ester cyclase
MATQGHRKGEHPATYPRSSGEQREVAGRVHQPGGYPGSHRDERPGEPQGLAVRLFRRYIELENARDYAGIEDIFHADEFVCHPWFGPAPIKPHAQTRMLRGLFTAFPDWQMEINEIIAGNDEVAVGKITGRGTQTSTWMGRPPSDHQIAIPLIHCIRVKDGKIVRYSSTVPWRDPFQSDFVAASDIQAAEATQGLDVEALRRLDTEALGRIDPALAGPQSEQDLQAAAQLAQDTCQALNEANMRRCAKVAAPGSLYCEWHNEHGYGVDDAAARTRVGP